MATEITPLFAQVFGFNIAQLLVNIVNYTYYILLGFILAWILIGWFPGYPSTRFFQAIYDAVGAVVNPIMAPLSSRIPPLRLGGIALNLAPIIAIFALSIGRTLLITIIANFVSPIVTG